MEESSQKPEVPILQGVLTDINTFELGDRLNEEDLMKFNSLIKIQDGIKNNEIEQKLTKVDISDTNNYILEFAEENKTVLLGDTTDLSTKMLWIKYFIEQNKNVGGTIHLNTSQTFFTENQ